jgi:hypothetical protein
VIDNVVPDVDDAWTFHQATGMVSVQLATAGMAEAARRLIASAAERDECVPTTAALVVARRVRLSDEQGSRQRGASNEPRGDRGAR